MRTWKIVIISAIMILICSFPAFAGTWNYDSKGWWFQRQDGSYPSDTWQEIDEKWYFFDVDGYMKTGWIQCGDNWYYCELTGSLATDQWINGTYYVGSDGAMYVDTTTPDDKKVNAAGVVISEKDYSMYIGEFTAVDHDIDEYGSGDSYLTITDIRDNKVYGHASYGYRQFSEEDFENGVEIQDDSFTVNGCFRDYSGTYSGDFSEPDPVPYTSKYIFTQRNGKNVIVKDDGTILYKDNR